MKVRKKPVIVEATQLLRHEALPFVGDARYKIEGEGVQVWNSLEDCWVNAPYGHWIIKGLKGEFYPCEPEVFIRSYDIVED